MLKTFSEFINESSNRLLFHFTTGDNLASILESDELVASMVAGTQADLVKNQGRPYMVSFSTSGSGAVGFGRSVSAYSGKVTIELDANRLRNLGKIAQVDYWGSLRKGDDLSMEDKTRYDEQEERLLLNEPQISNISRYITAIYFYVGKIDDKWLKDFNKCWGIASGKNIPFHPFENEAAYNMRRTQREGVDDSKFMNDVFTEYRAKEKHESPDYYSTNMDRWLALWVKWDDSRMKTLMDFLDKSKGVEAWLARYADNPDINHAYAMNRFQKMFSEEGRSWKDILYFPDGMHARDRATSLANDLHNSKIYSQYPTTRKLIDLVVKDLMKRSNGDIKDYLVKTINHYYEKT